MSEENVEAVRQGYAGFAENGVEGVIPFFTEDAVIYSIPEWPDDPEYHGHDGVRRLFRQWAENFDEFRLELRECTTEETAWWASLNSAARRSVPPSR